MERSWYWAPSVKLRLHNCLDFGWQWHGILTAGRQQPHLKEHNRNMKQSDEAARDLIELETLFCFKSKEILSLLKAFLETLARYCSTEG